MQGLQPLGHKRRHDSPTPERNAAGDAQVPPRKRHRLGSSSADVELPAAQQEGPANAEAGGALEPLEDGIGGELLSNGDVAPLEVDAEGVAAPGQASGSAAAEPARELEGPPQHDHAPGGSRQVDGPAEAGAPQGLEGHEEGSGPQLAADADASMEAVGSQAAVVPHADQETMQRQQQEQQQCDEITGAPMEEDAQVALPCVNGAAEERVRAADPTAAVSDELTPAEGQVERLQDNDDGASGLEHV